MRPLRLGLVLAVSAALVLTGCTDPSPEVSPTGTEERTDATADATDATSPSEDPEDETTTAPAAEAPEPPVFGTLPSRPGGAAAACVENALGAPLTFSTVVTAADAIVFEDLTLEPTPADAEVEILDAYVLPFGGGAGGITIGDYPPGDPQSAREDARGFELGAGESVRVGVGVTVEAATTMTLVLSFHGADEVSRTLTSQHELTIAQTCTAE